jgi:hypothetical protein
MVALAVPRLGYVPKPNLARAFLHRALLAQEAGNLLEAGVLLREAVHRQLYAAASWYGCLPKSQRKRRSPIALLHALKNAGCEGYVGFEWTKEIITLGNRAAHCRRVDAGELRMAIAAWHRAIDDSPCGEPRERIEHLLAAFNDAFSSDDDDDDTDGGVEIGGAL